jgi:hypothetical protein
MGRKQFESVVAQASREKLKLYTRDVTTPSIGIGALEQILIYSSPGTIAEVVGIRLYAAAPIGAASGTHNWYIGYKTGLSSNLDVLLLTGAFGAVAQYNYGSMANGTGLSPAAGLNGASLRFDDATPLMINYENLSNVVSGAARRFIFVTYVEREVRA